MKRIFVFILLSTIVIAQEGRPARRPFQGRMPRIAPRAAYEPMYRLPQVAVPENYKLSLNPDIKSGELTGEVEIKLNVLKKTRRIWVHAVGLRMQKISITSRARTQSGIGTIDPTTEMVEMRFPNDVPKGPATLSISYAGRIRSDLKGLYLSKAAKRNYAVTQFEGTYARMMFPSFDEPEYKATFDMTVVADQGDTAISNAAIADDKPGPTSGKHTIRFGTSPKMSTYLVALAVGDFKCAEGNGDGVPIRVCALPGKERYATFALRAAEYFMKFYNGYFSIKYPFGKLDMVAIPDYEWGGMENTASVFYKERALLVDEQTANVESKRAVASVVAHEMAHQWFGDLVTMQWWNDIWLNEGFATWMTPKALHTWDPTWEVGPDVAIQKSLVLESDARASTRAIRTDAETPAEIKELFDGIAYQKGGAVLHMMEAYLGEKVFRDGINAYLRQYANGNATSKDFARMLEKTSGKPVGKIMSSFVNQAGAPLLSVKCDAKHCEVSQERLSNDDSVKNATWTVPVCSRPLTGSNKSCEVVSKREEDVAGSTAVLFNAGATGYYRVAYTAPHLESIRAAWKDLTPAERINVLEDEWALVRAGRANAAEYLKLAETIKQERNRAVVEMVLPRFKEIRRLLEDGQVAQFDRWVLSQVDPIAKSLDTEPNKNDEWRSLRGAVFNAQAESGSPEAIKTAREVAQKFLKDPRSVDATFATVALQAAAENGGAELYDEVLARWKSAPTPELNFRYLGLLASFRDPKLVDRTVQLVVSPEVREQDIPFLLSGLMHNPAARDKAWQLLQSRWNDLKDKIVTFGGAPPIKALGDYCSGEKETEVRKFFEAHPLAGAERSVKGALEVIANCTEMKKAQSASLTQWLSAQR